MCYHNLEVPVYLDGVVGVVLVVGVVGVVGAPDGVGTSEKYSQINK